MRQRVVLKIDKRTREVLTRYESVSEAERQLGTLGVYRTCQSRLVGQHTWYLRFEHDFDPEEDFMGRQNCPVIAVDAKTGYATWYTSASSCARALGFTRSAVTHAIRNKCSIGDRYRVARYGKRITWATSK